MPSRYQTIPYHICLAQQGEKEHWTFSNPNTTLVRGQRKPWTSPAERQNYAMHGQDTAWSPSLVAHKTLTGSMLSRQRIRAARGEAAWNARRLARPNLDRDMVKIRNNNCSAEEIGASSKSVETRERSLYDSACKTRPTSWQHKLLWLLKGTAGPSTATKTRRTNTARWEGVSVLVEGRFTPPSKQGVAIHSDLFKILYTVVLCFLPCLRTCNSLVCARTLLNHLVANHEFRPFVF